MPLPINVMLPAPFIGGILTITWPYTRGTAVLVTIAVTSGASSSATMALVSAPMSDVGRSLWSQLLHLLARRYLAQLTTPQVGTLGSSSSLPRSVDETQNYSYHSFHLSPLGPAVMTGVLLLVLSRVGRMERQCIDESTLLTPLLFPPLTRIDSRIAVY